MEKTGNLCTYLAARPGLGTEWVDGNIRMQGGGGKDRKSLHILSCQAWDQLRVGGWEA